MSMSQGVYYKHNLRDKIIPRRTIFFIVRGVVPEVFSSVDGPERTRLSRSGKEKPKRSADSTQSKSNFKTYGEDTGRTLSHLPLRKRQVQFFFLFETSFHDSGRENSFGTAYPTTLCLFILIKYNYRSLPAEFWKNARWWPKNKQKAQTFSMRNRRRSNVDFCYSYGVSLPLPIMAHLR